MSAANAAAARPPSDLLDGQCMLTVVLRRCSSVHLSTAVQGDTPLTMHDLAMLIAAAHQSACAGSVRICGSCSSKRQSVAAGQLLTAAHSDAAERLAEPSHAMRKTNNAADSGYQPVMLDSYSTSIDDPVICGAVRPRILLSRYSNTRFFALELDFHSSWRSPERQLLPDATKHSYKPSNT